MGMAMHHCVFSFLQIGIIAKNVALGFHGTLLDWPEATPALFTNIYIFSYLFDKDKVRINP
jgi:hypothetical protein